MTMACYDKIYIYELFNQNGLQRFSGCMAYTTPTTTKTTSTSSITSFKAEL